MHYKNIAQDTLIYGSADFITKLIAFFTFPIVAAALSPKAFGVLDIIMTGVGLLGVFANCGLNNAVQRYYWDKDVSSAQQPAIVSSGLYMQAGFCLVFFLIILISLPFISPVMTSLNLSLTITGLLAAGFLILTFQATQYIQDIIRLHFKPLFFMIFSTIGRVLISVMVVIAVIKFHAGIDGILLVQAIMGLLVLPVGLYMIRRDLLITFDKEWAKKLFQFGHPFIFAGIAYWLFSSMDRWMLAAISSVEETGIYSVAFRFSTIILFIAMAFGQAWSPYSIKIRTDYPEHYRQIYAHILLLLTGAMILIGGGIALFAGEGIYLIMPEAYHASAIPLVILCFAIILQSTQQITATGISLEKKTYIFMWMTWGTAIFNGLGNLVLIPAWGASGAALATLLSYFLLTGGYMLFSQKLHPIPVNWKKIFSLLFISTTLLVISIAFTRTDLNLDIILIKFLIWASFAALLFFLLPLKDIKHVYSA